MSMNTSDRIQPPRLKDAKKNLQQIAVTASSQVVQLDPQLRVRWVRIKTTVDVSFYFRSDDAGTVDQALTTTLGSDSATLGYQMNADTYEDFMLGGKDNYIVVQGSGAGILQMLGSGPRRVVDGASAGP